MPSLYHARVRVVTDLDIDVEAESLQEVTQIIDGLDDNDLFDNSDVASQTVTVVSAREDDTES